MAASFLDREEWRRAARGRKSFDEVAGPPAPVRSGHERSRMDAPQASRKASRQDRSFTANADASGSGAVRALALCATTVRSDPARDARARPQLRVSADDAGLGVACKAISKDGNASLSLKPPTSASTNRSMPPRWSSTAPTPWSGRTAPPRPTDHQGTLREGRPACPEVWSAPLGPIGPHKKTRPMPRDRPRRVLPYRGGQDARPAFP